MNNSTSTGQCYPTFNDVLKCDIIINLRRVIAIVSMLCCLFIIFIIVIFKKYKFIHQRLILYLSISSFLQALDYAVSDYKIAYQAQLAGGYSHTCTFVGIWTLFSDWFSFLWVCCITFNIFWNAVFLKRTEKFEKFYFIVCFLVPTILCSLPFIDLSYGPAGLWCWIKSFEVRNGSLTVFMTGVILQLVVFYVPLYFMSLVLLVVLITVACFIRHRTKKYHGIYSPEVDVQKKLWQDEIRPLVIFPWIYLFILIFPLMNRIRLAAGFFEPDSGANFFFWFMHAITLTLHGTLYALVFACDKQTRSRINYRHIKGALSMSMSKKRRVSEYTFGESISEPVMSKSPVYPSCGPDELNSYSTSYELHADNGE